MPSRSRNPLKQKLANSLKHTRDQFEIPRDEPKLTEKIAFALLGAPRDEKNLTTFGHSSQKWGKVIEIKDTCIKLCKMQTGYDKIVCVNFFFVHDYKKISDPDKISFLLQVKKNSGKCFHNDYFIDSYGKVYDTWQDYEDDNIFDGWVIVALDKRLLEIRQSLGCDEQEVFDSMLKARQEMVSPGKLSKEEGKKEFASQLEDIENLNQFFKHFSAGPGTMLNINQTLDIDAKAFLQMTLEQGNLILKQSQDLQKGDITHAQFYENVGSISKEYRIIFEHQREEARDFIKKAFQVAEVSEIVIAGKRIFENLQPHELDRLHQVFKGAGKNYNPKCIKFGMEMSDHFKCQNVTEFAAVMEYFVRRLDDRVGELRYDNPNPKRPAGVRAQDHYLKIALEEIMTDESKKSELINEFNELDYQCGAENNKGSPRFKNSYAATNHYDKHSEFPLIDPDNNLSAKRYFELAREITAGEHVDPETPKWTQEGTSLCYTFNSIVHGAQAVRFDNVADGQSVIATLMRKDFPVSMTLSTN